MNSFLASIFQLCFTLRLGLTKMMDPLLPTCVAVVQKWTMRGTSGQTVQNCFFTLLCSGASRLQWMFACKVIPCGYPHVWVFALRTVRHARGTCSVQGTVLENHTLHHSFLPVKRHGSVKTSEHISHAHMVRFKTPE